MSKIKTFLIAFIVSITVFAAVLFICEQISNQLHQYSVSKDYYNKTEALLDSIYKWDNSFADTVMETDVYYEYEVARKNYNK